MKIICKYIVYNIIMEEFINNLKMTKKFRDSTLKMYARNLEIMAKDITGKDFKNLEFLCDFDKVKKYLKKYNISTIKSRVASLISCLKTDYKKYNQVILKYDIYLSKICKEYQTYLDKRNKSLKEEENWVTLKELEKALETHKKKVYLEKIHKNKEITKKQRNMLQDYVICALYVLIAPRRCLDYATMKIIHDTDYDKLDQETKENNNYLITAGIKAQQFSFGKYKTSSVYGVQLIDINPKLKKILNLYLKFVIAEQKDLLINKMKKQLSSNSLTKHLQYIFSTTGAKKISCSMLRHIYITYNDTLKGYRALCKEAEKISNEMGHSLKTNCSYSRDE